MLQAAASCRKTLHAKISDLIGDVTHYKPATDLRLVFADLQLNWDWLATDSTNIYDLWQANICMMSAKLMTNTEVPVTDSSLKCN